MKSSRVRLLLDVGAAYIVNTVLGSSINPATNLTVVFTHIPGAYRLASAQ